MRSRVAEVCGDLLMLAGAAVLLASLFLSWSHQFPVSLRSVPGLDVALGEVPADPTAWQVYSVVAVLLAALAAALAVVALAAGQRARLALIVPAAVGLAFAIHAAGAPPTNGLHVVDPRAPAAGYIGPRYARAGPGETLALVGLAAAAAGLGVGLASGAE